LLILLDEVHNLPPDDIMALLNASIAFGQDNSRFSIIAITRSMDWMKVKDEKMESRIQKTIVFQPYTVQKAYEILQYRANLAFRPGVIDEETVEYVATMVKSSNNMRTGIEVLLSCGNHCDQYSLGHITPEIVGQSRNFVNPEFKADIFEGMKQEELYTVLSIARSLINTGSTYTTIEKSFKEFCAILEEYNQEPKVIQTFYRYVNNLGKRRIFSTVMHKKRGKAKGQEMRLQLVDIDAKSLRDYVEDQLNI
jgi:Cdc6-like AAA superfamily ATPase